MTTNYHDTGIWYAPEIFADLASNADTLTSNADALASNARALAGAASEAIVAAAAAGAGDR